MNKTLASVAESCVVASPQGSGQEAVAKGRPVQVSSIGTVGTQVTSPRCFLRTSEGAREAEPARFSLCPVHLLRT